MIEDSLDPRPVSWSFHRPLIAAENSIQPEASLPKTIWLAFPSLLYTLLRIPSMLAIATFAYLVDRITGHHHYDLGIGIFNYRLTTESRSGCQAGARSNMSSSCSEASESLFKPCLTIT